MRSGCLIACLLTVATFGAANAETPTPAPPKCDKPENRQFDFWIGHWTVVNTKDGSPGGQSLIEKLYDGCTLRENWSEPGVTGGSLNTYVIADHHWHQTWTDSSGSWREFVGGLVDGKMVLIWSHPSKRFPGKTSQERMTFTPNANGTVRQYMDQTADGTTWVEGYDYTYKPMT
jgi:hypothetical protein